eukprot:3585966-Lingulodinium_polyedra.AAC.1
MPLSRSQCSGNWLSSWPEAATDFMTSTAAAGPGKGHPVGRSSFHSLMESLSVVSLAPVLSLLGYLASR